MVQQTDETTTSTPNKPSDPRKPLQQALKQALTGGIGQLTEQIRYLFALSHLNVATKGQGYIEPPTSIANARLMILETMDDILEAGQVHSLMADVQHLKETLTKLLLLTSLAEKDLPSDYQATIQFIWKKVDGISDPVARTQTLYRLAPLLSQIEGDLPIPSPLMNIVTLAQRIPDAESRLRSLTKLAPHLPYAIGIRLLHDVLGELASSQNDTLRLKTLLSLAEELPDELQAQALQIAGEIQDPSSRAQVLTALAQYMEHSDFEARLRESALDAIRAIQREEARAEALIAFAPHLVDASEKDRFPEILEKALDIAIGIGKRHVRARVLVALAPYLTTDLQGEALAAVHSLSSERERAILLAKLAPTLPSNMLVASLAVAHTMIERDSRVQALTALAHHVPDHAREQTIADALNSASSLSHDLERVTAIVGLFDLLTPQLMEETLKQTLNTTAEIKKESARARAIVLLSPHLDKKMHAQALDIALSIENTQQCFNALMGIGGVLTDKRKDRALNEIFDCIHQMPLEFKRARSLISVTPIMPSDWLPKVQSLGEAMSDVYDTVNINIAIIQQLPEEQQQQLAGKTWSLIQQIEAGYDRTSAIMAIAPYLSPAATKGFAQSAATAIEMIDDGYDKASAISILAPLLASHSDSNYFPLPDSYTALEKGVLASLTIPQPRLRAYWLEQGTMHLQALDDSERLYRLWGQVLWQLHTLPIVDVLLCLHAMMPILRQLADEDGLRAFAGVLGMKNG